MGVVNIRLRIISALSEHGPDGISHASKNEIHGRQMVKMEVRVEFRFRIIVITGREFGYRRYI